jgi:hypothetical protein
MAQVVLALEYGVLSISVAGGAAVGRARRGAASALMAPVEIGTWAYPGTHGFIRFISIQKVVSRFRGMKEGPHEFADTTLLGPYWGRTVGNKKSDR